MDYFINLKRLADKGSLPGGASAFLQMQHSTLAYTEMKAGTKIQGHNHDDDAVDIVLEGELEMWIGAWTDTLKAGMLGFVPSNVFHGALAITDCRFVTILQTRRIP